MSRAIARGTHCWTAVVGDLAQSRTLRASRSPAPPASALASTSSWLARWLARIVAPCMLSISLRTSASSVRRSSSSRCICSPASGVRSWCAALARNRCCMALDSRMRPSRLLNAMIAGAISDGACASSSGRRSSGPRPSSSPRMRASGAMPCVTPVHASADGGDRDQQRRERARLREFPRSAAGACAASRRPGRRSRSASARPRCARARRRRARRRSAARRQRVAEGPRDRACRRSRANRRRGSGTPSCRRDRRAAPAAPAPACRDGGRRRRRGCCPRGRAPDRAASGRSSSSRRQAPPQYVSARGAKDQEQQRRNQEQQQPAADAAHAFRSAHPSSGSHRYPKPRTVRMRTSAGSILARRRDT